MRAIVYRKVILFIRSIHCYVCHYVILKHFSTLLAFCLRCISEFLRTSCGCGTTTHVDTVDDMGQQLLYSSNWYIVVPDIVTATFLLCWCHLENRTSEMNKNNQLKLWNIKSYSWLVKAVAWARDWSKGLKLKPQRKNIFINLSFNFS